ncbi:MAG: carboxypeptidase-like regulatory domain-containing protein [Bacteroidales bacterium]|nr:carboxypeptidase-like regulatory domain-containing protein [Bacteroidales bacterium]
MKTQAKMIEKWVMGILLFLVGNITVALAARDSSMVQTYQGKIIDAETKAPIMYASVFLEGTNIGTVANADGEFLLKVPSGNGGKIGFSHLGYKTVLIERKELKNTGNIIALRPEIVSLQEIIVRVEDPELIIRGALSNISKNYSRRAAMVNGFYRETIQQNKRYVSVAEAVLEAYKSPYNNYFLNDKVKVLIGRKSQDVKKMDTIVVKFQGGPILPFYIDIAKNPENLINESFFNQYTLKLTGQVSLDDIRCYVIEFKQRKDVSLPLYEGKFYIDVNNLAFVAAEFSVSEYGLPYAASTYVKKKPATMKVDILRASYFVKYNKTNDIWNLAYTRSELNFKCKWPKRLFSSNYSITTEMAVTDIDYENVEKIKMAEAFKPSEIFSERVEDFRNDEFWGDYNIIVPEESVINAIKKLNRKLQKQ